MIAQGLAFEAVSHCRDHFGAEVLIEESLQVNAGIRCDVVFHLLRRDGLMPERGTLSIEKARKLLGYEPQFPIEKGFVDYINWYKSFYESNQELFSKPS